MITEVKVPELGENIQSATVSAILVAAGDFVEKERPLIELESEKASLEVPSPARGVIKELRVKVGDKIEVGRTILVLETAETTAAPAAPQTSTPQAGTAASAPQASAPQTSAPQTSAPQASASQTSASQAGTAARSGDPAPAAPSVRRLARELGADINEVAGSGPGGRISIDDVKAHVKAIMKSAPATGAPGSVQAPPLPDFSKWGEIARESLSGIRKNIAQNMAFAWNVVPHVTQFDEADITDLERYRKAKNLELQRTNIKMTVTALLLLTTARALVRFPRFNASLDTERDELIYKKYVNIGVAADTERGLMVPVLRDVDKKGALMIARELADLAARAKSKKLAPDEMKGGNFSVTNLGSLGTTYFSPIVNWPEVAVLGVGRAKLQPIFVEGSFVPRLILPLSLSYDHRGNDGADAARFLRWIAEALESPWNMFMDNEDGS